MKQLVFVSLMMVFCIGCSENPDSADKTKPQTPEERRIEITNMEKELKSKNDLNVETNRVLADRIVMRYRDYIKMNPTDSVSSEYLFKAAELSVGLGKYEAAINYLDKLTTEFPQYDKIVETWMFKGFVYENYMNSHAQAVKAYEELTMRYPNHRLAAEAKAAIENMTLSEEELLEKFKAMNPEKPES